jgi:hypothetical protein
MAVFILGLFVLAGILAIAFPLFLPIEEESGSEIQNEELEDLELQKESHYSAIRELEFDFKAKKLSRKDYEELRDEYKALAIETLSQIDELESGKGPKRDRIEKEVEKVSDDWIEEEVKKIKKARSKGAR